MSSGGGWCLSATFIKTRSNESSTTCVTYFKPAGAKSGAKLRGDWFRCQWRVGGLYSLSQRAESDMKVPANNLLHIEIFKMTENAPIAIAHPVEPTRMPLSIAV